MWLAQIPSWPPCFQVGYFSLCTFSGYLPQKQMPSKDIQDCLWWAPLPSHVSAAQNTLGSWSSFTQENKKKNNAQTTKRKLPRKVSSSSMSLCSHCSRKWNGLSNIIDSPEVPPTPGMVWSFQPTPKKKTIKPVIGSLASLKPEILQNLGSHEYTNMVHSRAIFVWLATHKITHKLLWDGAKYFKVDRWLTSLIFRKPIWDSKMNKCLESKQSNETCRPLSLVKNTFTWTMLVMISSCFYLAQNCSSQKIHTATIHMCNYVPQKLLELSTNTFQV